MFKNCVDKLFSVKGFGSRDKMAFEFEYEFLALAFQFTSNNQLDLNHWLMTSRSFLEALIKSSIWMLEIHNVVSSANKAVLDLIWHRKMSLMNIINKNGPRMEPCETP